MHVTVRESWTDARLDDFKERVDQRFDEVGRRFDRIEGRLDSMSDQLGRIEARIDSMGRAIIYGSLTLSSAMIASVITILTQV